MQREIGSNFWLDPEIVLPEGTVPLAELALEGADSVFLSSGRSALSLVLDTISTRIPKHSKVALLPPFTCHTVIEPFLAAEYDVHCFPVDEKLCLDGQTLIASVEATGASVVLVHRYFGFETLHEGAAAVHMLRAKGIIVIEDRTQSLYSDFPYLPADYLIGSLRKWAALPDGGFALCRDGCFAGKPTEPDMELERAKLEASYAKHRYLYNRIGKKEAFLAQYRQAEDILANQDRYFKISPTSVQVQSSINISELRTRRRENYEVLLQELAECNLVRPLFDSLPMGAVPLYMPVMVVGDRTSLQAYLARADIYAPVVWPRASCLPVICSAADRLYRQLLCLPIDQRYGVDDMLRMAAQIRSWEGEDIDT